MVHVAKRERADLYVVANMALPQHVSEEDHALWDKLRQTSRFNPRKAP
jgi:hypothetical protein